MKIARTGLSSFLLAAQGLVLPRINTCDGCKAGTEHHRFSSLRSSDYRPTLHIHCAAFDAAMLRLAIPGPPLLEVGSLSCDVCTSPANDLTGFGITTGTATNIVCSNLSRTGANATWELRAHVVRSEGVQVSSTTLAPDEKGAFRVITNEAYRDARVAIKPHPGDIHADTHTDTHPYLYTRRAGTAGTIPGCGGAVNPAHILRTLPT